MLSNTTSPFPTGRGDLSKSAAVRRSLLSTSPLPLAVSMPGFLQPVETAKPSGPNCPKPVDYGLGWVHTENKLKPHMHRLTPPGGSSIGSWIGMLLEHDLDRNMHIGSPNMGKLVEMLLVSLVMG